MYLYICIADVDCLISDKELNMIQHKALGNLDKNRCAKLVAEVFREYRSHTEDERKEYIRANVPRYLRTEAIRKKVINNLSDILPPDQNADSLEQVMFRYIRRIINVAE